MPALRYQGEHLEVPMPLVRPSLPRPVYDADGVTLFEAEARHGAEA